MCCAPFVFGDAQNTRRGKNKKKKRETHPTTVQCAENLCKKKNNGVENEKQKAKPKRQAHNIFCFFFLSLRNQRMWVPPAHFSPDHRDFHLCLKQRNEKRGNGSGVWVWAKTKQKLSNGCEMNAENRLQRVVYGVFIYFLRFFFFCFFFFVYENPKLQQQPSAVDFSEGSVKELDFV